MRTTTHYRRLVASLLALVVAALTLGASAAVASQHAPKAGLGYPSQAAADASRGIRDVQIRDAAHMALIENARRHGLTVQDVKPIGSRQFYVGPTTATNTQPTKAVNPSGGLSWTYPGVLAALSLCFALVAGGIVLAARRFKSRTVIA